MQYTRSAHSVISLPQRITALDMKLLIILSIVACSYAAKLDRTYLPPANAATAGGTPGSLTAPGSVPNLPSAPSTFTQAIEQGFKAQSGSGFESPASQYQSGASVPQFRQPAVSEGPDFGQAPSSFSGNQGSFSNQGAQDATAYSGQYQPERAQASADRNSEILRSDSQNDGENFAYSFETSNGITAEESGIATNGVQAQGGYSYTGDDGQQYRVTYTADENGYQPQGEHLPTPHPIPEEILRSLEENARAAAAGTQEGAYQPDEESDLGPQQYSNDAPSYQGQAQPAGRVPSANNQPGQSASSQYDAPSATRPSSAQPSRSGYQYQTGSNKGSFQNAPTAPGFSFPRGQAPVDQGPSPSTPTGSNVFASSGPRQPAQNQGQFGTTSAVISGSARQGQAEGPSGYQYNRPSDSTSFGRPTQSGQFGPQQPQAQPSSSFRPQSQGPSYSSPQGFGPTNGPARPSGQAPGSSNQSFGPNQAPDTRGQGNGPTFGSSGLSSRPSGSAQGAFPRPNSAQGYTPADPSASPSTSLGSAFPRPSSSSNDNGYVYGSGISSRPITKSSGQGFAPSGTSGNAGPSGSSQGTFLGASASFGQSPVLNSGFVPQGSRPTGPAQSSQESSFPRPNGPTGGQTGAAQGPFGGVTQYQSIQPQGSAISGPNGSFTPKAQGSLGASPKYQPNQSSEAQPSSRPNFSRPTGSSAGLTSATPSSQGSIRTGNLSSRPKSSMPNQSAPYQYNRPGDQDSQSGSTQNLAGSQPGFRNPEERPGQTFGGPRQPPSFSPEDGYKY